MATSNGYSRLKARYLELEKKYEEQQSIIEKQQTTISKLKADLHNSESDRLKSDIAHDCERDAMLEHMGVIRRWLWKEGYRI